MLCHIEYCLQVSREKLLITLYYIMQQSLFIYTIIKKTIASLCIMPSEFFKQRGTAIII